MSDQPPCRVKGERITVLNFTAASALWLCHSAPDVPPDQEGGGHYRSRSSFVWVKDGEDSPWIRTPFRSITRAMDAVMKARTAAEAIAMLVPPEMTIPPGAGTGE